jgi:hypothetical protein
MFLCVSKQKDPEDIYNKEIPKIKKHDVKDPNKKYFIPDSTLNSEFQKNTANI